MIFFVVLKDITAWKVSKSPYLDTFQAVYNKPLQVFVEKH